MEFAALVTKIQALELFSGFSVPEGPSVWAEAMNWGYDVYNRTAAVMNSGNRSPCEMFYGEPSQTSPNPFLKPDVCKYQRMNKIDPKAI